MSVRAGSPDAGGLLTSPAELVITGGEVYTVDAARSWSDAIAVQGGRIVAMGRGARDLIGYGTVVLDAAGGLVLPGFVDAHVHPATAGRNQLTVDLTGLSGIDEYLTAVGRYRAGSPDASWITGGGWAMEHFPGGLPRREDLDAVTGDRPAFLYNRDVHGAWLNTAALRAGGITAATPDPVDGRIERDPETREPTGTLHEGAAYSFESDVLPRPTRAEWEAAIRAGQRHLHALGVTGWQDAWVSPDLHDAYRSLDAAGGLTSRVVGSLWWDRHRGSEQIQDLLAQRDSVQPGNYRPTTVKIMIDGVLENGTGALLQPYCGCGSASESSRGLVHLTAADLDEAVTRLDALDFQVHMHAIGDRAVRMALDAVQAARSAHGRRENRHHVAHLQLIDPVDLPRFRELEVVANLQTYWAQHEPQMDELTVPVLGTERAGRQYPFLDLHRSGAVLAMGSDWGVTTANPLEQIEVAVTRRSPQDPAAEAFLPEQRLTLATAVAAFTAGSAFVNHDSAAGTLAPGMRADLVVLDRNIFAEPADEIAQARVRWTMVGGAIVHEG